MPSPPYRCTCRAAAILVAVLGGGLPSAQAACALATTDKGALVLENAFVRLVLDPQLGAKATSLFYKSATAEFCGPYGATADRLWASGSHGKDFWNRPYEHRVLNNTPEEVTVLFTARARSPGYTDLHLEKTVTLRAGVSTVTVGIKLTNRGANEVPACFWAFQNLADEAADARYFVPTADGVYEGHRVERHGVHTGAGKGVVGQDRFIYNPPRAWNGMLTPAGAGVVASAENRFLGVEYNWFGATVTMEWIYNIITLAPGASWTTHYILLPLREFTRLDGAAGDLAGEIGLPTVLAPGTTADATVRLLSGRTRAVTVEARLHGLVAGSTEVVLTESTTLTADAPRVFPIRIRPTQDGTHVLRVRVSADDTAVFEFERPVIAGTPRGEYRLLNDVEKRVGETMTAFNRKDTRVEMVIPDLYQPDDAVTTPCIPWAKPYRGGRVDVLFVLPTDQRDVIEMSQRLSMNYRVVTMPRNGAPEYRDAQVASRLAAAIADSRSQVLAVGGLAWDKLPETVTNAILTRVRAGCGLVYATGNRFSENDGLLNQLGQASAELPGVFDAIPTAASPVFESPAADWRAGRIGKGRVIFYNFGMQVRERGGLLVPTYIHAPGESRAGPDTLIYEYGYALLARSLLWAAGMLSEHVISIDVQAGTGRSPAFATVAVANPATQTHPWSVELLVKDVNAEPAHRATQSMMLSTGGRTVTFPLPELPTGLYALDVILRDNFGQSVNWRSTAFTVERALSIQRLELDQPSYAAGDTAVCTLHIENSAQTAAEAVLTCLVEDVHGWIAARTERQVTLAPGTTAETLRLALTGTVHRGHWVRASIRVDGVETARTRLLVVIEPDQPPGFLMPVYSTEIEPSLPLGFNGRFDAYTRATKRDVFYVPWYARWTCDVGMGVDKGTGIPDMADPEHRRRVAANVRQRATLIEARFRPPYGFLIDEWNPRHDELATLAATGTGHQQGFRRFLQEMYGDIQALNRQWETDYRGFDSVLPFTEEEHNRRVLGFWKSGKLNFSPWFDHQAYWETLTAEYIRFLNTEMQAVYPGARLGLSGMAGRLGSNCLDFWKLVGQGNMLSVGMYGGPALEIVRSFAPPEFVYTRWAGYDRAVANELGMRKASWFMLLHNGSGCSWYIPPGYSPVFAPDWRAYPSGRWVAEEDARINGTGLAHLLRACQRLHDGIAVHYSQPSLHAARLAERLGETQGLALFNDEHSSVQNVLTDMGLQFEYLAYEQIEQGQLALDRYRLLFLPYSQALSDTEAQRIRAFVQAGGIIVADIKPGVYDAHGRLRSTPCLDEVFGVQQKALPSYKFMAVRRAAAGDFPEFNAEFTQGEAAIALTGAAPLAAFTDGTPAILTHTYGRGRALLLNFAISDYHVSAGGGVGGEIELVARAKAEKAEQTRTVVAAVLAHLGITPRYRVTRGADGRPFPLEVVRFARGDARYVAVSRPGGRGMIMPADIEPIEVGLPEPCYVYDVLGRHAFGKTDRVKAASTPARPLLLALLPEPVGEIRLTAPEKAQPGDAARIRVAATNETGGAVRLRVKSPAGRRYLERTLLLANGTAAYTLTLPLNADPGYWTVEAVDTVSGLDDVAAIRVR